MLRELDERILGTLTTYIFSPVVCRRFYRQVATNSAAGFCRPLRGCGSWGLLCVHGFRPLASTNCISVVAPSGTLCRGLRSTFSSSQCYIVEVLGRQRRPLSEKIDLGKCCVSVACRCMEMPFVMCLYAGMPCAFTSNLMCLYISMRRKDTSATT